MGGVVSPRKLKYVSIINSIHKAGAKNVAKILIRPYQREVTAISSTQTQLTLMSVDQTLSCIAIGKGSG